MKFQDGIGEDNCARCGKHFVVQPLLVYKRADKRFCSWHCFNAYLTEFEANKHKRGKNKV